MTKQLRVFCGNTCMGEVGEPTGKKDANGTHLHVGDIVVLYDVSGYSVGLTAIVNDKYASYSDGTHAIKQNPEYFCMGIQSCGFDDPTWVIELVKSHTDVIDGEHWKRYGFNYRNVELNIRDIQ